MHNPRVEGRWWEDKESPHEKVFSTLEYLRQTQDHHRTANAMYSRFYSNRIPSGLDANAIIQGSGERIKINLIKSVIDAATAQIATNRPRPMFLTFGGDFSLKRRAKNLGRFIAGQFYATDHYIKALNVFQDACIFGTGFLKVYERDGKIHSERVMPDEIVVDDSEARYRCPRQLFQHKEVGREVAMALWPDHADEIEASKVLSDEVDLDDVMVDPVSVVEAWHLPSTPEAKDGRHIICVSGATVVDEPWELDRFPFGIFRWTDAPVGWDGIGLAEDLAGIQVEVDYLARKIQRLMTLATTRIAVGKGAGLPAAQITNQDMSILSVGDVSQIRDMPQAAVSPEYPAYMQSLIRMAYEVAGISQLQAQSKKPAGLNSGEAIRAYNDVASMRFQHVGQRWEEFHLDVAELMIDCARAVEERGDGDIVALAQGDREIEEIKFRDVKIDKDKYSMRVFPTSLLPETPAGKLQAIRELMEISPELQQYAMHLLDIPDLDSIRGLITAPIELADKQIEQILEHGKYHEPMPQMNLEQAAMRGALSLQRARLDGVEPAREELLLQWIDAVEELKAMAEQPPPQPGSPEPTSPGLDPAAAPGGMPPTSPIGMPPPGALPQ